MLHIKFVQCGLEATCTVAKNIKSLLVCKRLRISKIKINALIPHKLLNALPLSVVVPPWIVVLVRTFSCITRVKNVSHASPSGRRC